MFNIELTKKTSTIEDSNKVDVTDKKEYKDPFDVLVIGAGGAGYTAAIYSARYNLKTVVIGEELGGQLNIDYEIENYPGFKKIVARDLMDKFKEHVESLGVNVIMDAVQEITKQNNLFKITTMFSIYYAKTLILALGTSRRKLNVKGEAEFIARGVSYCATCDGAFYKDKVVAVIGGGDAAFASALILLQHAKKVYIVHRRDEFRAKPALVDQLRNNPRVEFVMNARVQEIKGSTKVESIVTDNPNYKEIKLDGVFIDIGTIPSTTLAKSLNVELDETGYIVVNSKQETNVEGVFAAGDITTNCNKLKQLIVACGEGALAATSAFEFLRHHK